MYKNLSMASLGLSARPSETIEPALSYGFRGIDLDMVDFMEQVRSVGLPRARRLLDSARLKISNFSLPMAFAGTAEEYQRDVQSLAEAAQTAQDLGCSRMTIMIEPAGDLRPYHENFELHRRRLGEIGALLARHAIRLGLGFFAPHGFRREGAFQFIQTAEAAIMLTRVVGAPNVGLALDLWHWHLSGGTPEQIQSLGAESIVSVTLSDVAADLTAERATEADRRLPSALGTIDSSAVLALLEEKKYDGPVAAAAHPSTLSGQGRDKMVRQASESLDEIWKAAGLAPVGRGALGMARR